MIFLSAALVLIGVNARGLKFGAGGGATPMACPEVLGGKVQMR